MKKKGFEESAHCTESLSFYLKIEFNVEMTTKKEEAVELQVVVIHCVCKMKEILS